MFISDLHLEEGRCDLTAAFETFMSEIACSASTLYILGDFFEVWVGDDDQSDFNLQIADVCRRYTDAGGELYLMVGNRDFLMGPDYAKRCGASLIPDPTLIHLNGVSTLLMHGDSLCTLDTEYMAFRQLSRSPEWQQNMLSQPLDARKAFAAKARAESQKHNQGQTAEIMDVTPSEVVQAMQQADATRLIHGHTHRPARHPLDEQKERIVLGDWGEHVWWLEASSDRELTLQRRNLQELIAGTVATES